MRRLVAFLLSALLSAVEVLSLLAAPQAFARAQTAAYAEIIAVDAQNFPQISALFDVYNTNGAFVSDLQPTNLTAYEDGTARPVDALTQSAVPVQIVTAINPALALDVRDGSGTPRFSWILETLGNWANSQPPESQDDLSLVSLSGSLISHANIKDWFVSLNSFKPDFRNSTPNLQTLSIALDTVNLPTAQPGMKRAILFITPHLDDSNIDNTIAPLAKRAVESKVRVFVWFVDGEEFFVSASANAFKSLAQQTNGSFFAFSGIESLPDPNLYFEPLRHIYSLTYTSSLTTPGDHTLGMYVETSQGTIPALDKPFTVDIQPPNPIFVSPPLQITRQPPADDPYNAEVLTPAQQAIEIIVEFPDGHKRGLNRTTLYVDGLVIDENTSAPFDKFSWDLGAYDESGQHTIIVEAEDSLGLKKSSISIPVTVTVVHVPTGVQALFARYSSYLVLGAIAVAGMALFGILLRSRTGGGVLRARSEAKRKFEDPLTQPVVSLTEAPVSATKKSKTEPRRAGWLRSKQARVEDAPAYLVRLTHGGEPASVAPIPVADADTSFGLDPVQSMHVLDDPSISPLHARIKHTEDGVFMIYDHGSVAGTWVNFEPVPREGRRLAHGDRIHFGMMVYRFDLNQPPAESEPKVFSTKISDS
ncbi:MAG TPA: FHA domain-containing protein, partial [Anaerolineales bacterium]|nr:FHA domain-containing protein [Anaerolineales bacterium]